MTERPKFLPSFIDLIRRESEERGVFALVPVTLMVCAALGASVAYAIPSEFWDNSQWGVSSAVYGGLMTFGGLILALGWNAFSRMYEILFRGDFGAYLHKAELLNHYLVHISTMHFAQVAAVVFAGIGLATVLVDGLPIWIDRTVFGGSVTLILFALKHALDAVTAMNDLAWQSAIYERHRAENAAATNVVKAFGDRNGK